MCICCWISVAQHPASTNVGNGLVNGMRSRQTSLCLLAGFQSSWWWQNPVFYALYASPLPHRPPPHYQTVTASLGHGKEQYHKQTETTESNGMYQSIVGCYVLDDTHCKSGEARETLPKEENKVISLSLLPHASSFLCWRRPFLTS